MNVAAVAARELTLTLAVQAASAHSVFVRMRLPSLSRVPRSPCLTSEVQENDPIRSAASAFVFALRASRAFSVPERFTWSMSSCTKVSRVAPSPEASTIATSWAPPRSIGAGRTLSNDNLGEAARAVEANRRSRKANRVERIGQVNVTGFRPRIECTAACAST